MTQTDSFILENECSFRSLFVLAQKSFLLSSYGCCFTSPHWAAQCNSHFLINRQDFIALLFFIAFVWGLVFGASLIPQATLLCIYKMYKLKTI